MYLQWFFKDSIVFETENLGVPKDKITNFDHIYSIGNGQLAFLYSKYLLPNH